jgi:hypothetical protein
MYPTHHTLLDFSTSEQIVNLLSEMAISLTTSFEMYKAYLSAGFSCGNKAKKLSVKRELPLSKGRIALRTSPTDTPALLLKTDKFV